MSTVPLIDGRLVDSASEEWRNECFARLLLRKPLEERRGWLADIEAKHGAAATDALRNTMTQIHSLSGRRIEGGSEHTIDTDTEVRA